jgi:glucan biosynthesis protein
VLVRVRVRVKELGLEVRAITGRYKFVITDYHSNVMEIQENTQGKRWHPEA